MTETSLVVKCKNRKTEIYTRVQQRQKQTKTRKQKQTAPHELTGPREKESLKRIVHFHELQEKTERWSRVI